MEHKFCYSAFNLCRLFNSSLPFSHTKIQSARNVGGAYLVGADSGNYHWACPVLNDIYSAYATPAGGGSSRSWAISRHGIDDGGWCDRDFSVTARSDSKNSKGKAYS